MRSAQERKAARWRASDTLMQMIEEELERNATATLPFSIRVLEAVAEAKRDVPIRSVRRKGQSGETDDEGARAAHDMTKRRCSSTGRGGGQGGDR